MDPMTLAALGLGAASLISGIAGAAQSGDKQAAAQAAAAQALQQWVSVNVPDPAQQAVILQKFQQTGKLDPQMEQLIQQKPTQMSNISVDPQSRAAEVAALNQMQSLASNGGMDAQAKQQEMEALNASNANEAGQRGAIVQDFAQRGQGGSGAQLAAELSAGQQGANSGAMAGMSSAANAQQRALQAMSSSYGMGQGLNSQDYGQAVNAAQAQDAINRFNAANAQQVAGSNTAIANNAQAGNLAAGQAIANANTGVANSQITQNAGLLQQQFGNEAQKAAGQANAALGVASQNNTAATTTANQWAGISSGLAGAAGAAYKSGQAQATPAGTNPVDPNKLDDTLGTYKMPTMAPQYGSNS